MRPLSVKTGPTHIPILENEVRSMKTLTIKHLLLALSLVFSETIFAYGIHHITSLEGESWINLQSSPLMIEEPQNKRFFLLNNISRERIVNYTLGYVVKETNGVKVICIEKEKIINLRPQDLEKKVSEKEILSVPNDVLERCIQLQAKIAVVQVVFADGAVWKANGLFSPCANTK